jgi:acetyltransferase-like isoleucine patch superfamily enzyme
VVGAGSLVLDDIPSGVLAYGRPAKVIRSIGGLNER